MPSSLWAFIVIGFAVLAWFKPRHASLVVVALIPAYRAEIAPGGIPITLPELLAAVLMVVMLLRHRSLIQLSAPLPPLLAAGILLGAGVGIGLVTSDFSWSAFGAVKGWFVSPVIFSTVAFMLWRQRDPSPLALALVGSTIPLSLIALWQVATGETVSFDGRASAWFGSPNHLALYLVPSLLLGLGMLVKKNQPSIVRVGLVISVLLGLAALWATFSYGGWLALIGGIAILSALIPQARRIGSGLLLLSMLLISQQLLTDTRLRAVVDNFAETSFAIRLEVWRVAWSLVSNHWLLGVGLVDFPARYALRAPDLLGQPIEQIIYHAHNFWLQAWLSLGLPGVAAFGIIVAWTVRGLLRTQSSFAVAILGAIAGWLLHGLADLPYFKYDLAFQFWVILCLGLVVILRHEQSKDL